MKSSNTSEAEIIKAQPSDAQIASALEVTGLD